MTVRSREGSRSASATAASLGGSSAAVASSRRTTGPSSSRARAMETRCFSPPGRVEPDVDEDGTPRRHGPPRSRSGGAAHRPPPPISVDRGVIAPSGAPQGGHGGVGQGLGARCPPVAGSGGRTSGPARMPRLPSRSPALRSGADAPPGRTGPGAIRSPGAPVAWSNRGMSTRSFGVRIRPAVPEDAEEIERIRIAGWRTAYRGILPDAVLDSLVPRAARHAERIRDPRGTGDAVALLDGRPAGWIAYGPARDDDVPTGTAEIYGCYVDPA